MLGGKSMADENALQAAQPGANEEEADDLPEMELEDIPPQPNVNKGQDDSSAKGMLRQAIQKVMEQIEFHEREAKKHLQQAKALRKDLRDSFAFLQERKEDELTGLGGDTRSVKSAEQETASKELVAVGKLHRAHPKKPGRKKGSGKG
jgi:hypothetical protein